MVYFYILKTLNVVLLVKQLTFGIYLFVPVEVDGIAKHLLEGETQVFSDLIWKRKV